MNIADFPRQSPSASAMLAQNLLAHSVDCIKLLTLDGRLHAMNPYGLCLMEIDDFCTVDGHEWTTFWPDTSAVMAQDALAAAADGLVGRFQGICPTAKGTLKWWDVVVSAVLNHAGTPIWFLVVSRDISLIKQTEQALVEALIAAEAARKERDAVLAIATHEIKNPLTALLGQTQLLQRRFRKTMPSPDQTIQTLDIILAQANRINRLISQLAESESFDHGTVDLSPILLDVNEVARTVLDEFRLDHQPHTLHIITPAEPSLIRGDLLQIEQVLGNLLSNAIKYSPDGGQITLTIEAHTTTITMTLTDQGIGIPAAALDAVFDRFYRAPNTTSIPNGIGVGLYVVRDLVQRHGGHIHVQSHEGAGSTFTITVPRYLGSHEATPVL